MIPVKEVVKMYLAGLITGGAEEIAKFSKRMTDDPRNAFEWAESAMRAAACIYVGKKYLELLNFRGVDVVKNVSLRELVILACDVESSSSVTTNREKRYVLAAIGNLVQFLEDK